MLCFFDFSYLVPSAGCLRPGRENPGSRMTPQIAFFLKSPVSGPNTPPGEGPHAFVLLCFSRPCFRMVPNSTRAFHTDPGVGYTNSQEIQLGTRGNFQLHRRNCDFPPLRINLKKGSTKGTIFETQDKLELFVACKLGQSYWAQYETLSYPRRIQRNMMATCRRLGG